MTLNASGPMSIGGETLGQSINLELDLAATANSAIGQTNFRELAEVPAGQISLSDFYGKSNVISPASNIQFWGVNAPVPNSNYASRSAYCASAVDITRQGEVISFGDNGTIVCRIERDACSVDVSRWLFNSTSLTILRFTADGNLPPSSAKSYTWSSAQASPGYYGSNWYGPDNIFQRVDRGGAVKRQTNIKDLSGNYYLGLDAIPNSFWSDYDVRQPQIKLNPDLSVAWAKSFLIPRFGSLFNFYGFSLAKNGDIYRWSGRFGSILKINSSGVLQWSYNYGIYNGNGLYGLTEVGGDSLGNCYWISQINGGAWRFDKLDSTGTWVKGWNWPVSADTGTFSVIAEDNAGNMWFFIANAPSTLSILKFDADFNLIWQRTLTDPQPIFNSFWRVSPKFDDNNNCVLLGNNPVETQPTPLISYSADGTLLWSRAVSKTGQTFDIALSHDFTKLATIGYAPERPDVSPYYFGFNQTWVSYNIGKMVLPMPVVPFTSNPLSNGTVNVTITITSRGTSSTPTRVLTPLSAPSRTAYSNVTLENIAVNVATTFPFVAKISEQLL